MLFSILSHLASSPSERANTIIDQVNAEFRAFPFYPVSLGGYTRSSTEDLAISIFKIGKGIYSDQFWTFPKSMKIFTNSMTSNFNETVFENLLRLELVSTLLLSTSHHFSAFEAYAPEVQILQNPLSIKEMEAYLRDQVDIYLFLGTFDSEKEWKNFFTVESQVAIPVNLISSDNK